MTLVDLGPLSSFSANIPQVVRKEGWHLLVCRLNDGSVRVFENKCTHADLPLHKGPWDADKGEITCPVHHAVFCVKETSAVKVGPAVIPLELFPVELSLVGEATHVKVKLPED
jgi:nitrite reductase/ring-hydroxylating ferredoxin subunit